MIKLAHIGRIVWIYQIIKRNYKHDREQFLNIIDYFLPRKNRKIPE